MRRTRSENEKDAEEMIEELDDVERVYADRKYICNRLACSLRNRKARLITPLKRNTRRLVCRDLMKREDIQVERESEQCANGDRV